jgi:hypothetical protein
MDVCYQAFIKHINHKYELLIEIEKWFILSIRTDRSYNYIV